MSEAVQITLIICATLALIAKIIFSCDTGKADENKNDKNNFEKE